MKTPHWFLRYSTPTCHPLPSTSPEHEPPVWSDSHCWISIDQGLPWSATSNPGPKTKWVGGRWGVGGGISQESVWSFHQIYYVNSQIVLKNLHPISNIFLQGKSNPSHCDTYSRVQNTPQPLIFSICFHGMLSYRILLSMYYSILRAKHEIYSTYLANGTHPSLGITLFQY